MTAVKDTIGLTTEQTEQIISQANNYAKFHEEGLVNINDFKLTIEKDLGKSLEELLRVI